MSSESENNVLNNLLGSQREKVSELTQRPYQPTVYAIPKEQWEQMLSLLKEQSEFNERLFTVMKRLPSARAIENFMNETLDEQSRQFKEQTDEVKESVRQAGSSQERFISEASSLMREQSKELTSMLDSVKKRLRWFTIAAVSTSILLSGLVSVLCLHWLK